MIGKLFAPLAMKVAGAFVAVLLVLLAVQTWRANRFEDQRDRWRTATAKWEQANADATRWARLEKAARESFDRANKEKADAFQDRASAALRPALDDYAARNRCVRREAGGGGGERADLPGPGGAAAGAGGAGRAAGLYVGIPDTDLAICAGNTVRLETAVGWAADYAAGPAPAGAGDAKPPAKVSE